MQIIVTICGRGGSKGVPGKNIKAINGKPLIDYTIQCAKAFAQNHQAIITLSTDDNEIRKVAADCGLHSNYTRPPHLAKDNIGKIEVIKELLLFEEKDRNTRFDIILDLDITAPLRTQEDLESALAQLLEKKQAYNIFSVSIARKSPYFNMVEKKTNGYFNLVKDAGTIFSRQQSPEVYEINGSFYFYRRSFFDQGFSTPLTPHSLVFPMDHICFDIDELLDFEFMEYLISQHKLDFDI